MTELRLEVGRAPRTEVCSDCGGVSQSTQGSIYRNGDAFAIYFATLYAHADGPRAQLAIGIGAWQGDGSSADSSGYLDVFLTAEAVQFGFTDPANSAWADSALLTGPLMAEDVRHHPRRGDYLAIAETIVRSDPTVASHVSLRVSHREHPMC
jgi:hypothetical protein